MRPQNDTHLQFLAMDFGAESGRGELVTLCENKIQIEEIHRAVTSSRRAGKEDVRLSCRLRPTESAPAPSPRAEALIRGEESRPGRGLG